MAVLQGREVVVAVRLINMLSIIIPTLNEEENIEALLQHVQSTAQTRDYEIIVVDGGSHDNTLSIAQSHCDDVLTAKSGRGTQLNAGVERSTGDVFLFLHADTQLPNHFDAMIFERIAKNPMKGWGFFSIKLSGQRLIFQVIAKLINVRSKFTSIATGDQCLFVTRNAFHQINGYKSIPLMEDVDFTKRLKKYGTPIFIKESVVTSSRRWEEKGVVRTILLMWWLRLLFFIGVSPEKLSGLYR